MDTVRNRATRDGPFDRETLVVGLLDVTIIAAFVLVGLVTHDIDPIADPIASLATATPFVVGWLVIAPLSGIYTRSTASIGHVARLVTVTWIAAANVGLLLRSSPLFDGGTAWPFGLVMTGLGLVVVLGWRFAYAIIVSNDAR